MSQEILKNVRGTLERIKPYSPGKPIAEVQREYALTDVIKLASNENPIGASHKAQEAIREALSELHLYPDGGQTLLKQALAKRFSVSEDMIVIGNGSDEVITFICQTFLEPGDEVVVPTPSFSEYDFGTILMGANVVPVPLNSDFSYDLNSFLDAITEKTKIVFLCSPNNPTGTYIRKQEFRQFIENLPPHVLVIVDEAYNEYVEASDYAQGLDFLKEGFNIVVMRTFSKLFGLAALRVGYAIGPADIIGYISRTREPFNVNHLAQVAALAALEDVEHMKESLRVNREGKQQIYEGLAALNLSYIPTETNFILFDTKVDAKQVFQSLLKKGVIVRDGGIFGLPTYIRVSIGTAEQNERFLRELAEVLAELKTNATV
ncbi:histidinol-phosphate aminotransferase [Collibacillus ludicampi]|jgi:histidinol-phosphate aminotransferase|uniref:Histidinol-phosphate aminotransferase n=1 Tax=Collibacillus ludicampi TaxID=2771369 RepID=A0AAV4LHV1_9BACL|nr:histidinol-phosphate transaminase [Collibacillus ludicampi]GIM47399.1 histidinol-phosphate aminotransferase [Collibacillus ludicampi]